MKPNIDRRGRMARGGLGVLFLLAAGCLAPYAGLLALVFLLIGVFTIFEAYRGWCAVRACGIKTPL
jgi:hypothetical protein